MAGYVATLLLTGLAIWATWAVPLLQARPFVAPLVVIIVIAWVAGSRLALLSMALSSLSVTAYLVASRTADGLGFELTQVAFFAGIALLIASFARARERSEREARRQTARLEAMFGQASIGIALISLGGRLTRVNRRMAAIVGRSVERAEGLTHEQLTHPDDWTSIEEPLRAVAAGTLPEVAADLRYLRGDGSTVWVHVSIAALLDDERRPEGLIATVEDISERHAADDRRRSTEAQLRESEERARLALEIARLGRVTWLPYRDHLLADPRCREICGLPERGAISAEDFFERVHPADRAHVEAALRDAVKGRHAYAEEFRIVHRDGSTHWVVARGDVVVHPGDDAPVTVLLGSVMDVTERRRTEEALRHADREKDDFLALLAHELRNPLAPIRTAVQLLKMRRQPDDEGQRLYAVIDRQVQHLVRMVDDLLDVSRVLRGKVELRYEPVDIGDAVAIAVETSRPLIDAQRQQLVLQLPDTPVAVYGDQVRLAQVIANLLNNASKYSEPGGTIRVTASQAADDVVIEVADTGLGIAPDILPRIFEPFVQADRSLERSRGGLGIGLTLVKKIIELHQGQVSAASAGPGRGSTFTVRLRAHVPVHRATVSAVPTNSASTPSRILVVDDNVDAAESLALLLESHGHAVAVAHNGMDAMGRADTWQPDIIVLDIGLPGMNGYEVATALRQRAICPDLIAVTGYGQYADAQRAFEAGFQFHLVKPVDASALDAAIAQCGVRRAGGGAAGAV